MSYPSKKIVVCLVITRFMLNSSLRNCDLYLCCIIFHKIFEKVVDNVLIYFSFSTSFSSIVSPKRLHPIFMAALIINGLGETDNLVYS